MRFGLLEVKILRATSAELTLTFPRAYPVPDRPPRPRRRCERDASSESEADGVGMSCSSGASSIASDLGSDVEMPSDEDHCRDDGGSGDDDAPRREEAPPKPSSYGHNVMEQYGYFTLYKKHTPDDRFVAGQDPEMRLVMLLLPRWYPDLGKHDKEKSLQILHYDTEVTHAVQTTIALRA